MDEYLEREKRRKNVVAFNIPEKSTTDQESDEQTFLNIMKDEFNLVTRIESVCRLGRPSNAGVEFHDGNHGKCRAFFSLCRDAL